MNPETITSFYCGECGSEIKKPNATKRRRNENHFCSKPCFYKHRRDKSKLLREKISRIYLEGKSAKDVNKALGISTADFHLKNLRLMRSRTSALINSSSKRYRDIKLSTTLIEIIEGNLLGDGCVSKSTGNRSGFYQHATKHKEHIIWLKELFELEGVRTSKIYIREAHLGFDGRSLCQESYSFKSEALPALLNIRNKWYSPKKAIPTNLVLTQAMLLHWYLGDGNFSITNTSSPRVKLCSQSFSQTDNKLLLTKLSQIGIKATLNKCTGGSGCFISLSALSLSTFFNLIGPCPDKVKNSYQYKWRFTEC